MKIEIKNGKAYIYTPYNAEFVKRLKNGVGGAKWDSSNRCWIVPEHSVESVRTIMKEVYGETDIPDESKKLNLKVTAVKGISEWKDSITLFGKTIASAYGRESGAKVGEDVVFLKGKPTSGGSVKNWETVINPGSEFVVYGVTEFKYQEYLNNRNDEDDNKISVEIIDEVNENLDKDTLIEERERLMKRIVEIDAILCKEGDRK